MKGESRRRQLFKVGGLIITFVLLNLSLISNAFGAGFLGHQKKKGCTKCHSEQYKSWKKSKHAKAFKILKPGERVEAKKEASLDPEKDYRFEDDCIKCHVTGFKKGGFVLGNKVKMKKFVNVGCEACHGPGKKYQKVKNKYENDDFPRKDVIKAGMKYGDEEQCVVCHNEEGPNAKANPAKYKFIYKDAVKKGTHEHVRLDMHAPRKKSEWLYE